MARQNDENGIKPVLIRPVPYEYESLESYLYRVGFLNGSNGLEWINNKLRTSDVKAEGFNFTYNDNMINTLSKLLNLDRQEIIKHTVHYYGKNIWSPSPGHYGKIKGDYLSKRFCYQCIYEKAYQRVYWLIDSIYMCPKHYTLLDNRCRNCGVIPTAYDLLKGVCKCGSSLGSKVPRIWFQTGYEIVNQEHLRKVFSIDFGIKSDNNEHKYYGYLDEIQYFKFIHKLRNYLYYKDTKEDIIPGYREHYLSIFLKFKNNEEYGNRDGYFYYAIAEAVLINWPQSMVNVLREANNRYYHIPKRMRTSTFGMYFEFNDIMGESYQDIIKVFSQRPAINMLIEPLKIYFKGKFTKEYFLKFVEYGILKEGNEEIIDSFWASIILGAGFTSYEDALSDAGYLKPKLKNGKKYYSIDSLINCLYELLFPDTLSEILFNYPYSKWLSINEASKLIDSKLLFKSIRNCEITTGLCIYYEGIFAVCVLKEEVMDLKKHHGSKDIIKT